MHCYVMLVLESFVLYSCVLAEVVQISSPLCIISEMWVVLETDITQNMIALETMNQSISVFYIVCILVDF